MVLSWDDVYKLVEEYIIANNMCPVPGTVYKGVCIGNWVSLQKKEIKKLTRDKIDKLKRYDEYIHLKVSDKWFRYYEATKGYIEEFRVLPKYTSSYNGLRVGKWYREQIEASGSLEGIQERLLGGLKEVPIVLQRDEIDKDIEILRVYIEENKRLPAVTEEFRGKAVGKAYSRLHHSYIKGQFSAKQIEGVRDIEEYIKTSPKDRRWYNLYSLTEGYISRLREAPGYSVVYRGELIGRWYAVQRMRYKKGLLSKRAAAYFERLEQLVR